MNVLKNLVIGLLCLFSVAAFSASNITLPMYDSKESTRNEQAQRCNAGSVVKDGLVVAQTRTPACCGQCTTSSGKPGCSITDSKGNTSCSGC